jgi:hypothetical protein
MLQLDHFHGLNVVAVDVDVARDGFPAQLRRVSCGGSRG